MVNKIEVLLPAKKFRNPWFTPEPHGQPGGMVKHYEVRKIAGRESCVLPQLKPCVSQLWASLYKMVQETK